MVAEDGSGQERLPRSGLRGHRRDHHAVAQHHLGIPLEEVVGQGRQVEVPVAGLRLWPGRAHARDEHGRQMGRLDLGQPLRQLGAQRVAPHEILQDLRPRVGLGEDLRQEVLGVQHLDARRLQHLPELVVLPRA